MSSKKRVPKESDDVRAFMRGLKHPLTPALEAVRQIILDANDRVREGIKWNSPSFRVKEYFATANIRPVRGKDCVHLVLYRGARVKDNSTRGLTIDDAAGILRWLAKERCVVTFSDLDEVNFRRAVLADIVNQWIRRI